MLYSLCSKLPLRSGLETGSASMENSTTDSSSSSNVLANQACTSEVLLQTFVVMLQNGNHKSLVRALIDTESQKSYILKSTAENLGFKYEEEFAHSLFGGSKTKMPVIKENSTSKIRPVFDASARTKGSPSLNDCLEKGPNFIEVIPTILNRFRKYKIGVISDIEKAFLQIGVREQDRDFLRFIWYDRENRGHIKIYRHRRVIFGVTSSPFLLGATLNHHLDNAHGNFDNVAKILRKSFYVDNCVTSFETEKQLQKFIVESKILLSSAHFNLRGWQSNVLLNPENFSELESQPDNFETMVLGLIWNLKDDCLSCNINCQKNEGKAITKRSLLSIANHIFDPNGFTAPVTLKPKLILQEIWKLKLKWDENLPKDILNQVKSG
ncbi:integrase catalytic domain-containing protein [Trichonephila clavipes]|nr:integrase catalytic domain-containing protein [Trichonephila clavipes]